MDLNLPELRGQSPRATPLGLEYRRMIAIIGAAQAASPTATAETIAPRMAPADGDPATALVALLSGARLQEHQIEALGGSFSPEAARYASDGLP